MNTQELTELLHVATATLFVQRKRGDGPPFELCGARVLYRRAQVFAWLESCRNPSRKKARSVDAPLLTEIEAAEFLGVERRDLLAMRGLTSIGDWPKPAWTVPYYKLGPMIIRYSREDLEAFKRANRGVNRMSGFSR